jgi:hypothetical protein
MTILLAAVGRDAVFLAADCITNTPVNGIITSRSTQKIRIWDNRIAWTTGGYAIANSEIEPALPRRGTIGLLNKKVIELSKRINDRMRPIAIGQGIAPPDVFSIVAGLNANGVPCFFGNAPSLGQYVVADKPGQFMGLGTDTDRVHQIATQVASRFAGPARQLPCDIWALQTVERASKELPTAIGFPIDMTLIRRSGHLQRLRVPGPQSHAPSTDWFV